MSEQLSAIETGRQEKLELIQQYRDGLVMRLVGDGLWAHFIKGPGKFEGEALCMEWFWGRTEWADHEFDYGDPPECNEGDGGGPCDQCLSEAFGQTAYVFEITPDHIAIWPELKDRVYVGLWERVDGFVFSLDDDECGAMIAGEDAK